MSAAPEAIEIVLGTAQLGADYGISNQGGRPSPEVAADLLAKAVELGVRRFDTSPAYGEGESILGANLPAGARAGAITKVAAGVAPGELDSALRSSLADLGADSADALLVHNAADLLAPDGEALAEAMREVRTAGLARKLGISVYEPGELGAAEEVLTPDVVQLPFNALDCRFAADVARLADAGTEVHARSIFLQGLLLMDAETVAAKLPAASAAVAAFDAACRAAGASRLEGAFGALAAAPGISAVVVGATSAAELEEIVAAARSGVAIELEGLASDDPAVIDPRRW